MQSKVVGGVTDGGAASRCRGPCPMRFCLRKYAWTLTFLLFALGTGWPQTTDGTPPADTEVQDSVNQVDSGQFSQLPGSDLDQMSTPPSVPESQFLGDIQVSTGAGNNPSAVQGNSSEISSVTKLLGNFVVMKSRRRSQTSIDYRGGDSLYSSYGDVGLNNLQYQRLSADETIRWRSGQLSFDDSFSYTSNRGFGSPSGTGVPQVLAGFDSYGATEFGEAYLNNVSAASITEELTRRSSAKFSGAYSITNYLTNNQGLFNSRQVSTQTEYSYQVSRRNNIGVTYGYQDIQFVPTVEVLVANSAQFVFQRRISERVNLVLGAGPERIVTTGTTTKKQLTPTVQASFTYLGKRLDLNLSYNRVVTSGAGLYAGGIQDSASASANWKFSRRWQATLNGSYFRVSVVGLSTTGTQLPQSAYYLAGAAVQRRLGRSLSAIANYQFYTYASGSCSLAQSCGPAVRPSTILIGLDWSIRPVRLE